MRTVICRVFAISLILFLICDIQVQAAALPRGDGVQLVNRVKRSMMWRWITQRPIGASCRDHSECGTNYCKDDYCSIRVFSS
ncbi:liver-expressed antimicrobial peptide 2-like [Acipenser ruthenus]|uniref:Liver-expressed antimicrobial peptide 2 n=2 Tax=Acipenseridae TaxID=7900 RepID=A0A4Y5WRS1_ACIBE|nr:liver-expressed antimicrobial peptide 2-like [Acipenser ruthenus]XP_058846943.1 liver-expressed antimicrobial peptide 2-like [Acipenser ruthenus]QDE10350.1 liver-expressed antimicrobial peptide 2C [Acipenser baerii]QDE10351.1 liver-expressed antimicrobial peptide 2C [Acipenser baerii]